MIKNKALFIQTGSILLVIILGILITSYLRNDYAQLANKVPGTIGMNSHFIRMNEFKEMASEDSKNLFLIKFGSAAAVKLSFPVIEMNAESLGKKSVRKELIRSPSQKIIYSDDLQQAVRASIYLYQLGISHISVLVPDSIPTDLIEKLRYPFVKDSIQDMDEL